MNRFSLKRVSPLAMFLAAGTALVAQSTGTLTGMVTDSKGTPIAGARVTISSPAMFAPRVLVTPQNGVWRAPLLPVGYYKVAVSKDGFVGSEAQNIRIGLGANARQDLVIKPVSQAQAVVEVVAAGAEADKADTKASANFSAEQLATLPGASRGVAGAADLAPGLTTGVGGSYSVRGGATQNTMYSVNGTSVKDDYQGDLTGTFYIEDNIEDVQVILSPLNARTGRNLGGSMNVVTKTGGNEFHGSIRADFDRTAWRSRSHSAIPSSSENRVNDDLRKSYQVTINGPIIKDRLWFALGTILTPASSTSFTLGNNYDPELATAPISTGIAAVDNFIRTGPAGYQNAVPFDGNAPYTRKQDSKYYEGKLTGAITPDHTLEVSYSKAEDTLDNRNPYGDGSSLGTLAALGTQTEDKQTYGFAYRGVLTASTFIEARYNKLDSATAFPAGAPGYQQGGLYIRSGLDPAYDGIPSLVGYQTGGSYPFGIGITPSPDRRNNRSGGVNIKSYQDLAGSHDIDFGYEFYKAVRGTSRQQGTDNWFINQNWAFVNAAGNYLFPVVNWEGPGVNGQSGSGNSGPATVMFKYLGQDGTTENRTDSFYINDQWTINSHWNLMLGLRYDRMKVKDTDGAEIANASDFSPRFQLRYDLNGDSKHLFTLTAARFNGDFTTGFTDAFIKKADAVYYRAGWSANPNDLSDYTSGSLAGYVNFVDYNALRDPANYGRVFGYTDNSQTYVLDKDLEAPYMDEITLGYRRNFAEGSSVELTYVNRSWKKDWAFRTDYQADQIKTLLSPVDYGMKPQRIQTIRVFNSNDLKREYNGLELKWTTKLSSVWTMGGNWTYSRLTGNNNGGDSNTGQSFRDNTPAGYYSNRNYLTQVMGLSDAQFAPTGPLFQDQTHRGRLHLTAMLPLGKGTMSFAWMLRYDSGSAWGVAGTRAFTNAAGVALASIPRLPAEVVTVGGSSYTVNSPQAPTAYTYWYSGRGAYRTNDQYSVDFKLSFNVPLGISRLMMIGDVQVYNLFNQIQVTDLCNDFAANSGSALTYKNYPVIEKAANFGTTRPGSGINYWNSGRSVAASLGIRF